MCPHPPCGQYLHRLLARLDANLSRQAEQDTDWALLAYGLVDGKEGWWNTETTTEAVAECCTEAEIRWVVKHLGIRSTKRTLCGNQQNPEAVKTVKPATSVRPCAGIPRTGRVGA